MHIKQAKIGWNIFLNQNQEDLPTEKISMLLVGAATQPTSRIPPKKTDYRRKCSALENNFNKTPMKTKTSKTIKACTFDNIQCLRLLKASGAKYSCITHKPTERNHYRLRPWPKVLYNRIWFIYSDIARKSNRDADAGEHLMSKTRK